MAEKVYIAAPYPLRDRAIAVMCALESGGCEVTSTWLKAPDEMADAFARVDLADVALADVLLALNPADWTDKGTGGRHVEFGYAVALGKPILLMGPRSNIFHHLSTVIVIAESDDLVAHIKALMSRQRPENSTGVPMSDPDPAAAPARCDHKFIDSKHCLKCGWIPPPAAPAGAAVPR